MSMDYEWDEQKNHANHAKHGVGFDAMAHFVWRTALIFVDGRQDYAEPRFLGLGKINNRLHVCVFTLRGKTHRIISLRKANRREEIVYEKNCKTTH